tara:strand:+ start:2311 stop:2766 length:456 start_codon:yes stop_codon:yes gene_type:complete
MKTRRKARKLALEILYEMDCSAHELKDTYAYERANMDVKSSQKDFALQLVVGVWEHRAWLDQVIHRHAPQWPLTQMAYIDRNILRIAIWEFGVYDCTPMKVAINEAVDIAKIYGSESSYRFVNGVLGVLADKENDVRQMLISKINTEHMKA